MSLKRISIAVVAIIVIAFVVIRVGVSISKSSNNTAEVEKTPQLETVVKQIVSSHLVSPGSAQFPDLVIKKKINTENQYVAFGDVDSQNAMGGLLRSHFFLTIIDNGGDKQNVNNWTVNQLDLGDMSLIFDNKKYDTPVYLSDLSEEVRAGQKQMEEYYRGLK